MKYFLTLLALSTIIFTACSKDSSDDSSKNNTMTGSIVPLNIGNVWTYSYSWYSAGTEVTNYDFKDSVVCDSVINGLKYSGVYLSTSTSPISVFYINKSDGFYSYSISKQLNLIDRALYPCAVGDKFFDGIDTEQVVSISKQITTPAGSFNCIEYSAIRNTTGSSPYWERRIYDYAPNIGLVYSIDSTTTDYKDYDISIHSLKSYTVK